MLRFVEEIAAQILHLLIFPQFTVTLSEFGHLSELGAFTLHWNTFYHINVAGSYINFF